MLPFVPSCKCRRPVRSPRGYQFLGTAAIIASDLSQIQWYNAMVPGTITVFPAGDAQALAALISIKYPFRSRGTLETARFAVGHAHRGQASGLYRNSAAHRSPVSGQEPNSYVSRWPFGARGLRLIPYLAGAVTPSPPLSSFLRSSAICTRSLVGNSSPAPRLHNNPTQRYVAFIPS